MYLIIEGERVVGISDQDTGAFVPDSLRDEIESCLARLDINLIYRNGDLLTEQKPSYWQNAFNDFLQRETKPSTLEINYGEIIVFPLTDLPILLSYANGKHRLRSYCDARGVLHMLFPNEWENILEEANAILSNLSNIRNVLLDATVNNEDRFNTLCTQLKHKVATYGRP